MEELQVIETTSGRQFKPWVDADKLQEIVSNPASVTAITSEIASGKQAIAAAINAKGGTASGAESFSELAEAVEEIPNLDDMVKLAGVIAGGNYNKNALQGHNENVKYGKTEIIDNVGAFEKINIPYCFQYWDLLERIDMPNLTIISGGNVFSRCTALQEVNMPSLVGISRAMDVFAYSQLQDLHIPSLQYCLSAAFRYCQALRHFSAPSCTRFEGNGYYIFEGTSLVTFECGTLTTFAACITHSPSLRNVTIGLGTDINLDFARWSATNVIAEGQSGIDELNSNLYNNLLTKLYDHSSDGQTRTLRIGWLAKVTAENIAYANAKGWTLTT